MNDFSARSLRPPIDPCEAHRITLSAALDGELQGASAALEMAETIPHLAGCSACQEFVRRARALDAVLAADALGDESPTSGAVLGGGGVDTDASVPHVPRAVWKRIEAEAWATERATAARKERWAWRVAAGLLLALAGVGLWSSVAERPASADGRTAGVEAASREGRNVSEFDRQVDRTDTTPTPNSTLRFGS
jgi:hypothetical protein